MKQPGFTLIEVLVAGLIATIMSIALFAIYAQVTQAAKTIENAVAMNTRIVATVQQLERDIAGVCIPFCAREQKDDETTATVPAQGQLPEQKPQRKKITRIFYGTVKDEQLDMLTFITNNPLQGYWSDRAGKAKPALARVVYRLERDTDKRLKKPAYKLTRQEAQNLDLDAFNAEAQNPIRSYTLVKNIKKFTITYALLNDSESDEDTQKESVEVTTQDHWDKEKAKKDKRIIPHDVTCTMSLWDAKQEREVTVTFAVAIIPDFSKPVGQQEQKALPQPPAAKPAQPMPAVQKTSDIMKRLMQQGGAVVIA